MSRGEFVGLCYVCGIRCGHTYCREHKWCAEYLGMPYRKDNADDPYERIAHLEKRLEGWRNVAKRKEWREAA